MVKLFSASPQFNKANKGPCSTIIHPRQWLPTILECLESDHDDVIKWKYFPRNWPFVRRIHRSPVNSTHKGQWRGVLMFSLICTWINSWVNNPEAGDLRCHRAHCDVSVMCCYVLCLMLYEKGNFQEPVEHNWRSFDFRNVEINYCIRYLWKTDQLDSLQYLQWWLHWNNSQNDYFKVVVLDNNIQLTTKLVNWLLCDYMLTTKGARSWSHAWIEKNGPFCQLQLLADRQHHLYPSRYVCWLTLC